MHMNKSMVPFLFLALFLNCSFVRFVDKNDNTGIFKSKTDPAYTIPLDTIPRTLPFRFRRHQSGTAISQHEIDRFSREVADFFRETDLFKWIVNTSYGIDSSTGMKDFMVWWRGVKVLKRNDSIVLHHTRHSDPDNIVIYTARVLGQVSAGYLLTRDTLMALLVEQYCKGIMAQFKGMIWNNTDTDSSIMARAVFPQNHEKKLLNGKTVYIDYSAWHREKNAWNAENINIKDNPYWGNIWVRTMRSKDDLPHLYRASVFLHYVAADTLNPQLSAIAQQTLGYIQKFAQDIVMHTYRIRTKDKHGNTFVPDKDLAGFTSYDWWSSKAECTAKLATMLLASGETGDNRCGKGRGGLYDIIAPKINYFNMDIIHGFHMSATLNALLFGKDKVARNLIKGLAERADKVMRSSGTFFSIPEKKWNADAALFLVQAASCGLPLTYDEARMVQACFRQALLDMRKWRYWKFWSDSVDESSFPLKPEGQLIGPDEIAYLIEYCFSPFKNPDGAAFINKEIVQNAFQQPVIR